MNTITLVLSIVLVENLQLEQLDVKTTFLHSTTRGFPSGHDSIAVRPTLPSPRKRVTKYSNWTFKY